MRRILVAALAVVLAPVVVAGGSAGATGHGTPVTGTYSTGADHAWQPLAAGRFTAGTGGDADTTVVVDPSQPRQRYTGMGFSLDETSVSNLWKLTPTERDRAVRLLVDPVHGAGLDRFRITIGSPDVIEHLPFWSEDDLPAGVTADRDLRYFSIQRDLDLHIIDTIKLIQRYDPRATFFASAWSAPAWMKTNDRFTGEVALKPGSTTSYYQVGKLRDDCVDVFARYYTRFVQAYARHGIRVDAITLLNEPGIDVVYPAMDISVPQQQRLAVAIKRSFHAAGLSTQLYGHDFNFWDWRDPTSTETKNYHRILDDPAARAAIDDIAFHPYWGDPTVMRDTYQQTGKPVQMTETSDLSPATVLDYLRLDAGSYILWAQATDQDGGTLHWTDARDNDVDWDQVAATNKWPDRLVTVNTLSKTFSVRDELYTMGQFARYLDQSDVRVESSGTADGISNVAFRGTGDRWVTVVGNGNDTARRVKVVLGGRSFTATVPAHAYATFRWTAPAPPSRHHPAPVVDPVPDQTVDQYSTVRVPLHATDPAGDPVSWYADELPAGSTLDAATGILTLHPTAAGNQAVTVTATDGAASANVTVHVTVRPHGAPVGETVEAESYVAEHGWTDGGANFVESSGAASGGADVGWTAPGNWLSYRVDIADPGTYDLELRVANGSGTAAPGAITVRDAAGAVLATASVPDTGGWQNWRSVHVPVTLPAGDQLVTVWCETGGFNLDYLRLT
jgi:glucosylceramidase